MNPMDYRPFPMANLNRPSITPASPLTEAELDAAIGDRHWPPRRVEPLPPMDFLPAGYQPEAAHAASEIDDDYVMTASDRVVRAWFWRLALAVIFGSAGYFIFAYRG